MKSYPTLGILGGTFNPIHFGHLRLAEELCERLNLDQVRFIPSANPPLKAQPTVSARDRAAMVELAIAGNPKFSLDTRELAREEASYTIDTLISLRQELGSEQPIALLLGSDAFLGLNRWHQWQALLSHCHIVVTTRPQFSLDTANQDIKNLLKEKTSSALSDLHQSAAGCIYLQAMTPLDISSSQIRGLYTKQQSPRYLLPDSVLSYINDHHLYSSVL